MVGLTVLGDSWLIDQLIQKIPILTKDIIFREIIGVLNHLINASWLNNHILEVANFWTKPVAGFRPSIQFIQVRFWIIYTKFLGSEITCSELWIFPWYVKQDRGLKKLKDHFEQVMNWELDWIGWVKLSNRKPVWLMMKIGQKKTGQFLTWLWFSWWTSEVGWVIGWPTVSSQP